MAADAKVILRAVRNGESNANLMSKREAFALAAMQGLCAAHDPFAVREIAQAAVAIADAMLKELG